MFCPNCGIKNEDAARFCAGCGTPLALAASGVAGAEASAGGPGDAAAAVVAVAVANKGRLRIVVIAILLLAILAAAFFGAKTVFARNFAELFSNNENYARNYVVDRIGEIGDSSLDAMVSLFDMSSLSKSASEFKMTTNLSESYIDDLLYEFDIYDYETVAPLFYLLGASSVTFTSRSDFSEEEMKVSVDGDWEVKGSTILSGSLILADGAMYLRSPELYPDTLAFSLADIGLDESMSLLDAMNAYLGYYGYFPPLRGDSLAATGEYAAELKPMIRDLAKAAAAELPFGLDKNAAANINGKRIKMHAITLDFSERDLSRAWAAALGVLRENDEYLELLSRMSRDFLKAYGMDSMNKSEIKREITTLIEEARYASRAEEIGHLELYVDARNKPAGLFVGLRDVGSSTAEGHISRDSDADGAFSQAFAGTSGGGAFTRTATESGYGIEFALAAVPGKGYEFRYADEYTDCSVYGDLKGGLGSANGTINLRYYDYYDDREIDIPLGKFSDLSFKEYQGMKVPNFTWNFSVGEIMEELALQDAFPDGADRFGGISGELKYTASGDRLSASLKLEDGRDASFTMESSSSMIGGNLDLEAPEGRDVVFVRLYDLMDEVDFYALLDNVTEIAEKLEDKGFDVYDLFYELEEGIRMYL
jgi:hypothetical protein